MPSTPISLSKKLLEQPPKNGKYYLAAIDGRGGAGKTTLLRYIQSLLPDFAYICGDDYFEPLDHPIAWGGYNEDRFYKDVIEPLKLTNESVNYRPYDWDQEPHYHDQLLKITNGVFIDRCYSFSFDLNYDLKIWVETPRDITLDRGIERSTMPKERAEKVWRELFKPMEDRYIGDVDPIHTSDIVLDGTKDYEAQLVK